MAATTAAAVESDCAMQHCRDKITTMAAELPSHHASQSLVGALRGVFSRHPEVRLALLFGSQATQTSTSESDVDLAVLGSPIDELQLIVELSQACHCEVDIVLLDNPTVALLEEVVRDGIVICENGNNIYSTWRSHALSSLELDRPWYNRMRDAWLKAVAERGI